MLYYLAFHYVCNVLLSEVVGKYSDTYSFEQDPDLDFSSLQIWHDCWISPSSCINIFGGKYCHNKSQLEGWLILLLSRCFLKYIREFVTTFVILFPELSIKTTQMDPLGSYARKVKLHSDKESFVGRPESENFETNVLFNRLLVAPPGSFHHQSVQLVNHVRT